MPHLLRLASFLFLLGTLTSQAQDDPKVIAHPASKVVRDYLQLVLQREWTKSAGLVEPNSLKQLHQDFLRRLKAAPTMDDEAEMTRRVGKQTYTEVENMAPVAFYTAYHEGIQERWKVSPEVIKKVRDSLKVRLLSIGEEDADHVHILVRTKHSNDKAIIENLELISLTKMDGAWKVALNEQAPKITPLDSALPPDSPDAKPAPEKPADPPAAGPAPKTAPKPAPKATPAPKKPKGQ
jgi:hypothetical protein